MVYEQLCLDLPDARPLSPEETAEALARCRWALRSGARVAVRREVEARHVRVGDGG